MPDPCLGVDCSGHGRCVRQGDEATCLCDPGFHQGGILACVPDEISDCTHDSDCDDGDACTTQDICTDGVCQAGTIDKDTDGDGYLDAVCPGGSDCRDDLGSVHPGATEGPVEDPSCTDGLDNDCDHATDGDDVACMMLQPLCDQRDWCFEHPLPQGDHLFSATLAGNTIWVVGAYGTVLRHDQTGWNRVDLWIYPEAYQVLGTVWAGGENDVWVAGGRDFIWHWDGSSWQDRSAGTGFFPYSLFSVAGAGPWMAGNDRRLYTWDGAIWTFEDVPYTSYITCIWGLAPDDLWLAGYAEEALHWDGAIWNSVPLTISSGSCVDIWGAATDDLWGLFGSFDNLYHWNGTVWEKQVDVDFLSGTDIWAWSEDDIWMSGLYIFGQGNMYHYDGATWSGPIDTGVEQNLNTVVGRSPDDVWAFGYHGVMLHYNGMAWERVSSHLTMEDLHDVWRAPGGEAWAVGDSGTIMRRSGDSWSKVDSGVSHNLHSIWGVANNAIWAVGDAGCILHWNGSGWSVQDGQVTNNLNAIWGVDADHLLIVGDGGVVLAGGQGGWGQESSNTSENLMGVHGTASDDVWAVGASGTTLHREMAWSQVVSNTTSRLRAVWALAPDDVWAVGSTSVIHWDGSTWTAKGDKWTIPDFQDVGGTDTGDMWIAGTEGYILHNDGTGWQTLSEQAYRSQYGLWVDPTDIWIVGEGGLIVRHSR